MSCACANRPARVDLITRELAEERVAVRVATELEVTSRLRCAWLTEA